MAQINLMQHQHTHLPASKHKKGKSFVKPRSPSHKNDASDRQPVPLYYNNTNKKSFDAKHVYKNKGRCQNVEILCMQKVSRVQQKSINARLATSMDTLLVYFNKRNKFLSSQGNQSPIYYKQEQYMLVTSPYVATQKICLQVMGLFACKSRYSASKLIVRQFPHHIT